jgi:peptide-methionine (S)-S-oxide reductase
LYTDFQRIGFGGGCHWCTEAVFQSLKGIDHVAQGFIKSAPPADTWSEAVIVTFDPSIVDLATLIEIHLRTHASTSHHEMRGKYRSAIYTFDDTQQIASQHELNRLQSDFEDPLVTNVLPYIDFKESEERFHNYYQSDPARPFCKTYIDPKLAKLRKLYANKVRDSDGPEDGAGEGNRTLV